MEQEYKMRISNSVRAATKDIEEFEAELAALRARNAELEAKLAALVEAADAVEQKWALVGWGYNKKLRDKLKAAVAAVKRGQK